MPAPPHNMSSQLENTSSVLGEYMLKGWTLTDLHCDTCHITPLMREPGAQASAANRTRIQFCAHCDGGPEGRSSGSHAVPTLPIDPNPPISSPNSSRHLSLRDQPPTAPPTGPLPGTPLSPPSSARASTISSRLSPITSTTILPRTISPSSVSRNRSAEDHSELISQKLLQGYSLLQINCPNEGCRGVPLIGFPRAKDGSRDPRRMCVACGTGYVSEGNMGGMRPVQPTPTAGNQRGASGSGIAASSSTSGSGQVGVMRGQEPESPRSKRRRELYETGEAINKTLRPSTDSTTSASSKTAIPKPAQNQNTSIDDDDEDDELLSPIDKSNSKPILGLSGINPKSSSSGTALSNALNNVNNSLALTLDRLASSLAAHTAGEGETRYFVDVKLHTEAVRDVLECVERVRRVQ